MSNNGIEFGTPDGRLIGGGFELTPDKDDNGNPKMTADGKPMMSMYLKLAIPKVLNGSTAHWDNFLALLKTAAAQAWPQFWPQGPAGSSSHPRFAMKFADGDGVDNNGKSNASKPGHAGHWIVTFGSQWLPKCYVDGKFAAHEVMQDPASVIKLGYYIRIIGDAKSNNADIAKSQIPGIALYPKMVVFRGQGEEISFGLDAEAAAARWPAPQLPPGVTGAPLGQPGQAPTSVAAPGALPAPTTTAAPLPAPTNALPAPSAPVQEQYTISPTLPAGTTIKSMTDIGWKIEDLVAQGHVIKNY